mgnify:CR=1 FL=1
MISLFGAGFIGKWFYNTYPQEVIIQERDNLIPYTNEILFMISTVDNYHVFTDAEVDIFTNQILAVRVLEEARKKFGSNFTFTYVSTWFVYGDGHIPATENQPCNPKGFYSITRLAGEQLVQSYCETFGANWRILRLGSVLGVGDNKASMKKNAMQFIISELVKGKDVEIYREASYRDFIDVRDCVRAIHITMQASHNEIYNIGNGEYVNVKETLEDVAKSGVRYGKTSCIPVPKFHSQVQCKAFIMDNSKLKALGYKRQYSLKDTLKWVIQSHEK